MKSETNNAMWYVVADGSRARVVILEDRTVRPALNREFIGKNLKQKEIIAHKLGQRTPGRPAIPTDPTETEKGRFASDLAEALDKSFSRHQFEAVALVAPAEMLGDIRRSLSDQVKQAVAFELDKDFTQLPDDELAQRLHDLG